MYSRTKLQAAVKQALVWADEATLLWIHEVYSRRRVNFDPRRYEYGANTMPADEQISLTADTGWVFMFKDGKIRNRYWYFYRRLKTKGAKNAR